MLAAQEQRKRERRWWVRPWIGGRNTLGACSTLLQELRVEDPQQFRIFLRMSAHDIEKILNLVGPIITKENTNLRDAISANDRLAVTFRFLATGMFI